MTNHARMAPAMGLAMGAMVPAMAHGPLAGAGLAFVAAHVALGLAAAALALFAPALRARLGRLRPTRTAVGRMAGAAALGFAAVCARCLVTWHGAA